MTTREQALEQACLIATTGSIAYGLNHANSDVDQMGIFIAPASEIAGLRWGTKDESWTNTSPDGDDLTMHEIGKFLRNTVFKGNPTLIELLYMNEYDILTPEGEALVNIRYSMLSEKTIRNSYYGYANSQLNRIMFMDPYKEKMARHTLRIARQGSALLTEGTFNPRVEDPQEYFDLTELPKDQVISKISAELQLLGECESVLPDRPNVDEVYHFLRMIRLENP